jgi:hypothetical protein
MKTAERVPTGLAFFRTLHSGNFSQFHTISNESNHYFPGFQIVIDMDLESGFMKSLTEALPICCDLTEASGTKIGRYA